MQAHHADRAFSLGDAASKHGHYLFGIAVWTTAAFLLSIVGRIVFVRACLLTLSGRASPGREVWRVPPAAAASYVYTALLLEILFYALSFTFVAMPVIVLMAGLAAATAFQNEQPGLVRPLARVAFAASAAGPLLKILLVFFLALLFAFINLYAGSLLVIWMAGAVPGLDLSGWLHLFRAENGPWPAERLPALLMLSGAVLAVEPFWLASMAAFIRRSETRRSGEDLSQWFEGLRGEATR
jgi:hypothetical protein